MSPKSISKSAILLTLITKQKCIYMPCFLTRGSQQVVRHPASFLSLHSLCILYYFYHSFYAFSLLRGFWPYIWPQTPFTSQNHTDCIIVLMIVFVSNICLASSDHGHVTHNTYEYTRPSYWIKTTTYYPQLITLI